MKHGQKNIKI